MLASTVQPVEIPPPPPSDEDVTRLFVLMKIIANRLASRKRGVKWKIKIFKGVKVAENVQMVDDECFEEKLALPKCHHWRIATTRVGDCSFGPNKLPLLEGARALSNLHSTLHCQVRNANSRQD